MTSSEPDVNRLERVSIRAVLKDTINSKPPAFKHSLDMTISNQSKSPLWVGIDTCKLTKIDKDLELIVSEKHPQPSNVTRWKNKTSADDAVITLFLFTDPSFRCVHVGGESQVQLTDIVVFTNSDVLQTMNILVADEIVVDGGESIEKWIGIDMTSKTNEPMSVNHSSNESESLFRSDSTSGKYDGIDHTRTISLRGARLLTVNVEKAEDFVDYTSE